MRNQHYKSYSFRLNEKTINKLKQFKKQHTKSWNLLFVELIKNYERKNTPLPTCPICKKNKVRPNQWSCDWCAKTMTAEKYNQFLVDNFDNTFKNQV